METKARLLDSFEKMEIKPSVFGDKRPFIRVNEKKTAFTISKAVANKFGLQIGDRFDLYRKGKTFALQKTKAGVLRVSGNNGSFSVHNKNSCIEILAFTGGEHYFDAWVENDCIFFKPSEGSDR